jgi:PAS domain S-box-containing protein
LQESEEKYRTLINQSSSIVIEWDPDGVVLYLNPYGLRFFGFAAEEIIGQKAVGKIIAQVDSSGVNLQQKLVDIQKAPDTFYSTENENLRKNGETVWVAWSNRGIYGPDGKLIKTISFGIDRTEQRAAEQRLHAQFQQLQQEIVRREQAEEKLRQPHAQLEERVLERVKELTQSNERLTAEIAERKRTEMALAESEEQYRSLISAMNEGVTLQDETSAIIAFNQSAERILGLTADQLRGKTSFDPIWRSIREDGSPFPSDTHPVVTTLRTGLPQSNVIMGIHKPSGELTWISINARPIFMEGSKTPYRVVATMHDVTERKRSEEALRASEERFRTLSDNAMVGVNIIQDGRLIYVNPAFAKVFGYHPSELIGESPLKVIHPDDQDMVAVQIKRRMSGEQPFMHYEFRGRTKNGDTKHIEVFSTRFVLNDRPGIIANLLDVTERKQADIALRTMNRHLRAISSCNEFVVRAEEEHALLEGVCTLICEKAGYRMAWVGYAEQDEEKTVRPVVWAGAEQGDLSMAKVSWADTERGRGPTGVAIRHAETVCIEDFETDPRVALWRERALEMGYRSSIALPLRHGEAAPFGALSIYSSDVGAFSPDEVRLLEQLATDLAFGIGVLRGRVEKQRIEAKQRETETRFRAAFMTGAVAFFILEETTGRVLEVNDQFLSLYGYSRDEVIGRTSLEVGMWAIPEDLARLQTEMECNDQVDNFEVMAQRKGGEAFWVLYSVSRLSIAGPPLILGAIHDITARKEAESRVADYVKQLESTLESTLQAVSTMVEIRDPYTAGHERRVGAIAADIAREMGWSEERCHRLHQIGLVHDIGKIAVPAEILTRPTRLSAIEFELVKEHAERGWEILKMVKSDLPIGEIVRQHHERMDGSGYPRGLKGDEIMLEARILAVADVLESMASHRPYRPALGVDAAIREIESGRGTKFDEQVVDALLALINDKGYRLPQ